LGTGELYLTLVSSTKANAKIISIDSSAALAMQGVVCFLDHTSVIKTNLVERRNAEEEIFASKEVRISSYYSISCYCCCLVVVVSVFIAVNTSMVNHFYYDLLLPMVGIISLALRK